MAETTRRAFIVGSTAMLMAARSPRVPTLWLDRLETPGTSTLGNDWSAFTDGVMGGVSEMAVAVTRLDDEPCYRMSGTVRTANNGGFIQIALPLSRWGFDATGYAGVRLRVRGNGERYAVHLRTTKNRVPWDYFTQDFEAGPSWTDIDLPFSDFATPRGRRSLTPDSLTRIALVGIGRDFEADVALAAIGLYGT